MNSPRRLLIISTTFYPDPQVSAIRMTQWCRHLPEQGWRPHVICRHYGYECSAEELASVVHPDVTVEYLDTPVPTSGVQGKFGWVRGVLNKLIRFLVRAPSIATFIVPDVSIRYWRRQRQHLLKRVQELQPDVILTTSPPHSNHDVGMWLAAQTGIPWVADFRDPYMLDNRFRPVGLGLLRWGTHNRFRTNIYRRAWLITQAIPVQERSMRRFYPVARGRILALTNGYPPELLEDAHAANSEDPARARRVVLVAGTITEPEQESLSRALEGLVAIGSDVVLKLVGKPSGSESILRKRLGDRVVLTGYLSHCESVCEIASADVLVNFLDDFRSQSLLLSTKLFEYFATGKPVVCINPSRSDRLLLNGMSGVAVLVKPSLDAITAALQRALTGGLKRDPSEVESFRAEYNWPRRVRQLSAALDNLVAFPPKVVSVTAGAPVATVVIPTRNRGALLGQCIRSALSQSVPVEVIVMDDGSTDGTVEMVRRDFPMVRCHALGSGQGPCFQRNRGIEMARSEIVFPIDDDSVFSSPHVVKQTLREFDHPRIGAVGLPFLNPRLDWTKMQRDSAPEGCHVVHAFVGAAHALRRSVFLAVGGYREHYFYMGEEGDLCLRMLASGYVTRLGRSDPVYHMESPRRNLALANRCGRRNDICFAWHNVPTPYLPLHLLATTVNGMKAGIKTWHFWRMTMGALEGYRKCFTGKVVRQPVNAEIYWLHRHLKKSGSMPLQDVEKHLPPLSKLAEALSTPPDHISPPAAHVC